VRPAAAAALLAACLSGCATTPPASPEGKACLEQAPRAKRSSDYTKTMASFTTRAVVFSGCMEAAGYELDEAAVSDELLRIEQVRNADQLGGDPQLELRVKEQELRASPRYWRRKQ
jgi:hypothetical protein